MKIFVFVVLFMAAISSAQGNNFVYNCAVEDGLMTSQTIYSRNDDRRFITPKSKYNYTYDEQQRVVKKEVLRWSVQNDSWVNSHCLNWTFVSDGFIVEYAKWDEAKCDYTDLKERRVIIGLNGTFFAVNTYSWSKDKGDWMLKENMPAFSSSEIYSFY